MSVGAANGCDHWSKMPMGNFYGQLRKRNWPRLGINLVVSQSFNACVKHYSASGTVRKTPHINAAFPKREKPQTKQTNGRVGGTELNGNLLGLTARCVCNKVFSLVRFGVGGRCMCFYVFSFWDLCCRTALRMVVCWGLDRYNIKVSLVQQCRFGFMWNSSSWVVLLAMVLPQNTCALSDARAQ